eukprot:IDg12940t1
MPCLQVNTILLRIWEKEYMTEEQEEKEFSDEAVSSLDIIAVNMPDVSEVLSQITIGELVNSQMHDIFSKEIRLAVNRGVALRLRDSPYTEVIERISLKYYPKEYR